MLHNNSSFKKNKRDVDFPFSTREQEGRELKDYYTLNVEKAYDQGNDRYGQSNNTIPVTSSIKTARQFGKKNELTSHSGRFSNDLLNDVEVKNRILS